MTSSIRVFYALSILWTVLVALFCWRYAQSLNGISEGSGDFLGRDFINFWAVGKFPGTSTVADLYDAKLYRDYLISLFGEPLNRYAYSYPPHAILFFSIFGVVSYFWALFLWSVGGVATMYSAVRNYRDALPHYFWLICPATFICLFSGQIGLFLAGLFIWGMLLSPRKPVLAGILIGCLTIKPQLGPLLVIALIVSGQWKTIISATVTTMVLVIGSILFYGVEPWSIFLFETLSHQSDIISSKYGVFDYMVPSVFKWAINMGWSVAVAWALQALSIALSIYLTIRMFRSNFTWLEKVAVLCVLTFLFSPYMAIYDMAMLLPAAIILFKRSPTLSMLLVYLPFIGFFAASYNVPLFQISLIGVSVFFGFKFQSQNSNVPITGT